MLRALQLLLALSRGRAGTFGDHAKARSVHVALLAAFGLATFAFLAILATVALAQWLGLTAALAVMAAVCAAGCGGVLLAMRAEARAHEAALRAQAAQERRFVQTALMSALPALRRGGLLAAVGVLALMALTSRGRDDDDPRT